MFCYFCGFLQNFQRCFYDKFIYFIFGIFEVRVTIIIFKII
nr:MAG TPA: hypothetical protein [Caudoviricetes sp.]